MSVTPPWTCDQCGQPILSIEDGWVEWLDGRTSDVRAEVSRSLRLVHHRTASPYSDRKNACYHDEDKWFKSHNYTVSDLPLSSFVGPDGLVILLSFLADKRFADPGEVLEMIKRLHVPNYEKARNYLDAAISDGVFEPRSTPTYHTQEELRAVVDWVDERSQET